MKVKIYFVKPRIFACIFKQKGTFYKYDSYWYVWAQTSPCNVVRTHQETSERRPNQTCLRLKEKTEFSGSRSRNPRVRCIWLQLPPDPLTLKMTLRDFRCISQFCLSPCWFHSSLLFPSHIKVTTNNAILANSPLSNRFLSVQQNPRFHLDDKPQVGGLLTWDQ